MKTVNSHLYEKEYLKRSPPILSFDEDTDFDSWQKTSREKLTELLGLPLEECDNELEIEYKTTHENFVEYRFKVQTEPGYFVPCHLLIPLNCSYPAPLTICLSGHGSGLLWEYQRTNRTKNSLLTGLTEQWDFAQ